ncbi:hypothetical protein JW899_04620, partial [Candidatus Uhrbacteria bacterium]|nr:hypothetical protein [Candidatus Uhrbacteria bacterium]
PLLSPLSLPVFLHKFQSERLGLELMQENPEDMVGRRQVTGAARLFDSRHVQHQKHGLFSMSFI